jgi:hypothetical protein
MNKGPQFNANETVDESVHGLILLREIWQIPEVARRSDKLDVKPPTDIYSLPAKKQQIPHRKRSRH